MRSLHSVLGHQLILKSEEKTPSMFLEYQCHKVIFAGFVMFDIYFVFFDKIQDVLIDFSRLMS